MRQENLKGTACFCFLFRPMDIPIYWHGLLKSFILLFKSRNNNSIQLQSDHVTVPNSIYSGLFLRISNFSNFKLHFKQSSVETKEAQVSLNSLHCLFLCCLRSVSTLQGQVEPSFLEKRKFKKKIKTSFNCELYKYSPP